MKKTIIILSAFFLLSSFGETKVSYKSEDIEGVQKRLQSVFNYVDKSNLPHQDVQALEKMLIEASQILGKADTLKTK